jgi:hypothetical protein
MVDSRQRRKQEIRIISIAGNRYRAATVEDIEDFMFAVSTVKRLQLLVVTSYKCSVDAIINPTVVSSH